jgi:hypothetical protein
VIGSEPNKIMHIITIGTMFQAKIYPVQVTDTFGEFLLFPYIPSKTAAQVDLSSAIHNPGRYQMDVWDPGVNMSAEEIRKSVSLMRVVMGDEECSGHLANAEQLAHWDQFNMDRGFERDSKGTIALGESFISNGQEYFFFSYLHIGKIILDVCSWSDVRHGDFHVLVVFKGIAKDSLICPD